MEYMEIIVGVAPDESGDDAVALGAVLSRLLDASIVLAFVHPPTMEYPSMGNVDAEWTAFLAERAEAALHRGREALRADWGIAASASVVVQYASVGHGLRNLAESRGADVIAIGPGSHHTDGRVSLGSVAHSLLHGGPAAVALAPEGYRETAPEHISRLVVGFQDTAESIGAAEMCVAIAGAHALPVQLLTVVLRMTRILGARVGRDPERMVMDSLRAREEQAQFAFVERQAAHVTGAVVMGDTAEKGMARFAWEDGDVFVAASSDLGPISRVFLGDTTHKLIRACTVPAIVLPRRFDPSVLTP